MTRHVTASIPYPLCRTRPTNRQVWVLIGVIAGPRLQGPEARRARGSWVAVAAGVTGKESGYDSGVL